MKSAFEQLLSDKLEAVKKEVFELAPDKDAEVQAVLRGDFHSQEVTSPSWQQRQVLITMALFGIKVNTAAYKDRNFFAAVAELKNQLKSHPLCWPGLRRCCNQLLSATEQLLTKNEIPKENKQSVQVVQETAAPKVPKVRKP